MPVTKPIIVREYEDIVTAANLSASETEGLRNFILDNQTKGRDGSLQSVLEVRNNKIKAKNYVGVLTTNKDTVIEILPKIDLGGGSDQHTKECFLQMLRTYLGDGSVILDESYIKRLNHFEMLEVFVSLFLNSLQAITKRGLAKRYEIQEENLPYLKGKIVFPQHIRNNIANQAQFFVEYSELTTNRPANRLIRSTIDQLLSTVKSFENKKVLRQLGVFFADIPKSTNYQSDWDKHQVDRTMQHYTGVMQWVGLFLFGHGLTTYSGIYKNKSLLFPMERIFESFVGHHFLRHQYHDQSPYRVQLQGPAKKLMEDKEKYKMRPDITLSSGESVKYILDTKWKHIEDPGKDMRQGDLYQLYAYGKKYGCKVVGLIYPKTKGFNVPKSYSFDESLELKCFPFDVTKPEKSTRSIIQGLDRC